MAALEAHVEQRRPADALDDPRGRLPAGEIDDAHRHVANIGGDHVAEDDDLDDRGDEHQEQQLFLARDLDQFFLDQIKQFHCAAFLWRLNFQVAAANRTTLSTISMPPSKRKCFNSAPLSTTPRMMRKK